MLQRLFLVCVVWHSWSRCAYQQAIHLASQLAADANLRLLCICEHTCCAASLRRYLYDSPLESQLTQVFDANKRLLYTGDAVPEEVSLVKGDHTARVMLRHDNIAMLEKLKNTCLVGCASLSSSLNCSACTSVGLLCWALPRSSASLCCWLAAAPAHTIYLTLWMLCTCCRC